MDGQSGETKKGIHTAILAVMKEVGVIGKDRLNEGQNYKFRGIDDVVERVGPLLVKHGITCMPTDITAYRAVQVETKKGHAMHVTCIVEHTYEAADGSKRIAKTLGEAMDSGDKASNKAMSAALKYSHCEVFEIATFGKDADTESQSPELTGKMSPVAQQRSESGRASTFKAPSAATRPAPKAQSGATFPPYGRSKGAPVAGASKQDLEFYRGGCLRSLADPAKSNFHAKEKALLAAIDDELSRHDGMSANRGEPASRMGTDEPPPHNDADQPF